MRIAILLGVVLASTPAHADGAFFEGDVGLMVPMADDDYETAIDESFKLGLRLGSRTGSRALDVSFDFTPANDNFDNAIVDLDFKRYRFLFGARIERPINPKAVFFVRGAVGIDLVHTSGQVLGQDFGETDAGLGLEVSGGVMFDVGNKVQVGGKLGIPFAFHFDDDDPADPDDIDNDYTGIDLDLAFVLAVKF